MPRADSSMIEAEEDKPWRPNRAWGEREGKGGCKGGLKEVNGRDRKGKGTGKEGIKRN